MNANQVWDTFLGAGNGSLFRSAVQLMVMIPETAFTEAREKIETETALGPLVDPSAYVDGRRFDNARDYQKLLRAALDFRRALSAIEKQIGEPR